MKKSARRFFSIALALTLLVPAGVFAQAAAFQLSLANPIQLVEDTQAVAGVSLGLFYTVNTNLTGYNWSLVVNRLHGNLNGVQSGMVNLIDGQVVGAQSGFFNSVRGSFNGLQGGFINYNRALTRGAQFGFVNMSGEFRGFQMGFVNMVDDLYGLQIGLVNLNGSGEPFGFLPIANWSF